MRLRDVVRMVASVIVVSSGSDIWAGQTASELQDTSETVRIIWLPGAARRISRSESASRDTPVLEYAYGPKAQCTIGAEWAWCRIQWQRISMRIGMYAMIPLENHGPDWLFPPYELWRGMTGISCAWSADALARRWFGEDGGAEVGVILSHESDHEQGFTETYSPGDIRGGTGGQALTPDMAVRIPLGTRSMLTTRVQCRAFIQGTLITAPGADFIVRCRLVRRVSIVVALFGEGLFPRAAEARNGFFVRCMTGLTMPGEVGELTAFGSVDAGNGIGLLVNHRGVRVSAGLRYAPFTN